LHPYRALILSLAIGFLAAGVVGAVFVQLAELVQQSSVRLELLDHEVWASARLVRTPAATWFFTAWTLLGTSVGLSALVLSVALVLFLRGRRRLALFLSLGALGGWGL